MNRAVCDFQINDLSCAAIYKGRPRRLGAALRDSNVCRISRASGTSDLCVHPLRSNVCKQANEHSHHHTHSFLLFLARVWKCKVNSEITGVQVLLSEENQGIRLRKSDFSLWKHFLWGRKYVSRRMNTSTITHTHCFLLFLAMRVWKCKVISEIAGVQVLLSGENQGVRLMKSDFSLWKHCIKMSTRSLCIVLYTDSDFKNIETLTLTHFMVILLIVEYF